MTGTSTAFLLALAAGAGTVAALAGPASRAGLADDPAAAPEKKLQAGPVPTVGGAALLVGLVAASAALGEAVPAREAWPALLVAFTVGLVDDRVRGGLRPGWLLLGQGFAAAALVASGWRLLPGDPVTAGAATVLAAVFAMNAANTFDNADGAAASLGVLGLAVRSPLAAAPLLGFLPFNLWLRRGGAPLAYLGNSGSHVLGLLLLVDPVGRAVLLLPLLDLARIAVVRTLEGSRPWRGDRRHLAHRLQAAGLPATGVVAVLLAIAAPSVLGALVADRPWIDLPAVAGLAATAVTFAVAACSTPRPS